MDQALNLKQRCLERGPFSPQENAAIYEEHFQHAPRRWLRRPLVKYGLGQKRVLDVGCAYGAALAFFGPGSVGLDISARATRFAQAIGLTAIHGDILDPAVLARIPREAFDAVWCSHVLEHVAAPHDVLMVIRSRVRDNGLLLLGLPPIPQGPVSELLAKALLRTAFHRTVPLGYTAEDHISAFTRKTARFMLERAGFAVLEQRAYVSSREWVNTAFNVLARPAIDRIVCVARKIPGWDYPPKSTRHLAPDGWVFRRDYVG